MTDAQGTIYQYGLIEIGAYIITTRVSIANAIAYPCPNFNGYLTKVYTGVITFPYFNPLRLRRNGRYFPDDIFKCIFLNENLWISIKISLEFVPKGPINNIPALVQIMAWRRPGDKPLSEPMLV